MVKVSMLKQSQQLRFKVHMLELNPFIRIALLRYRTWYLDQLSTVASQDVNAVSKRKISNQRFIKLTIPELNCPRNLSYTVPILHASHFKGIKISPDNSPSYSTCRNCPQTQLTPNRILDYKAILASPFNLDQSAQDTLYSPQGPDLASLVIGEF
ncbi:hypothetical protein TNCV_5060661 [Trichonephila clavipes]|nr:hypothetical protein TNCV_5060661 [Trichonephila clavipes]